MTHTAWIAVDWGTTHLRVWGMDAQGCVVFEERSSQGMSRLAEEEFEPVLETLLKDRLSSSEYPINVVACGMVGSRQGWIEAGYRTVPCKGQAEAFAKAKSSLFDLHVVPGIKQDRPADVMRGEEVQIAGYLAGNKDFDGVMCLPGSHSKWVRISAEEVVSFQTVMTGEMFGLLTEHSVLRHSAVGEGIDDALFLDAVSEGMSHPARLTSRLFSLRAESLLTDLSAKEVRSRMSGLLIGMELAATKPYWLGQQIVIVGAKEISELYAKALREEGCPIAIADGVEMTLNGLRQVWQHVKEQK